MNFFQEANQNLNAQLRRRLPPGAIERLRKMRLKASAWWHGGDLIRLGQLFNTDKWGSHWYLQHYQTHFRALRTRRLNLIEIGVGGYADPYAGGNSLRMWKAYFPHAQIFGIDIHKKQLLREDRIHIFEGSQVDQAFLRRVVEQIGGVDIVIDDGSHLNQDVPRTFEILFPLLRNPGIYVIEDTQTSYWPGFGGSSTALHRSNTIMGYFTRLVHALNYQEILRPHYSPNDFDRHIVGMHFYHNLIFIGKGDNTEASNILRGDWAMDRKMAEAVGAELPGHTRQANG